MSKGFDNEAVGLSQLYSQTRIKTVTNDAAAAGANIRHTDDGAVPPVAVAPIVAAPASNKVLVRAIIANRGSLGGLPVRISAVVTAGVGRPDAAGPAFSVGTPLLSLFPVLNGVDDSAPPAVGVVSPSACIEVLPDPTTGEIDVALPFSGDCTVTVSLQAGQDFITGSFIL